MAEMTDATHGLGTPGYDYIQRILATSPDDDGPVWMVNFMHYRAEAAYLDGSRGLTGRQADDLYAPLEVLDDIGATIPFVGDVVLQLDPNQPRWDRIGVVRYPTRASFLQMQTRPDFLELVVHKVAGMASTIVTGCQPLPLPDGMRPDPASWAELEHAPNDDDGPVMVVHMMKFAPGGLSAGMAQYQAKAGQLVKKYGGGPAAMFAVEGTVLGDGRGWDQVRFVAYPSMRAFAAMVADPERVEAQANHRNDALEHTYTVVVRATRDTFTTDGPV
jgi:uncharacterized protein (DUF1330 family)